MLAQVENILQISRLEKGNLHLEREPLDVHELISNAIGHLQVMLDERGGVLRTHFLAEKWRCISKQITPYECICECD